MQRRTIIAQEHFLENVNFFYASTIDKTHSRKLDTGPMSVVDAYKKHVNEWFINRPESLNVLELCYEDLVHEPLEQFGGALDYLELDMPVAKAYLGIRVSLYSDETRPRAKAQGWKESAGKYDTIIAKVEELLANELELLGYKEAVVDTQTATPSSDTSKPRPVKKNPATQPKKKAQGTPGNRKKKGNRNRKKRP